MSYVAIPKAMRKIEEEKFGISHQRIGILVIYALVSLIFLFKIGRSEGIIKIINIMLLLGTWGAYYLFFRTKEVLERSVHTYNYLIRRLRNQTVIPKYATSVTFLESIVPIRKFNKNGLIEFVGSRYGLLLKIEPARISDDELDQHIHKVKEITDSLHGEMMMKTFVVSRSVVGKPLEKNLVKLLNDNSKTQEQKAHLYGLYHEVHNNTSPVIEWNFYIFLGLGSHNTVNDAEISRQAQLPGFEARLRKAGIHAIVIQDSHEVAMAYRTCMSQVI